METKTPTQPTPEEQQATKELGLLVKLSHNEEFRLWRDQYVKPQIEQMKLDLAKAESMTEPQLRAKLMNYQYLEEFFYGMFDKVEFALKQENNRI